MTKKLIFIVGCPRSGTTLLLSYLCGVPNTKVLYETRILNNGDLDFIANYFDSIEEEIVIEKTPEHCLHLESIEALRDRCKRDIHVIYIVRPPIPTILSLLSCGKTSPELFGKVDLLGACEKYEESLISIYNNLILKSNEDNMLKNYAELKGEDTSGNLVIRDYYVTRIQYTPYSLCVNYRDLVDNPYEVIKDIVDSLKIKANVQSLIDSRVTNIRKVLPIVETEEHHSNIFKSTEEVEEVREERLIKIVARVNKGIKKRFTIDFNYISNYFEHPKTKESIYDLVVNNKVLEVKDNPQVTIVVPLYNKEKYIVETLTSILNQTYQNIKVVVIEDCSTDKSLKILEEYYISLPLNLQKKVHIIRNKINRGVSYTRNVGLSSNTDIYSFCDADDIWDKELVEKSVKTFKKYPYIDCVYSRVLKDTEKLKSKICNGNIFLDSIESNILNCGSNLFVKASFLIDNNIKFDESITYAEDWEFLLHLAKEGAAFKCTKEYLVTYRQVPESATKNITKQLKCSKSKMILNKYIYSDNSLSDLKKREMFSSSFTKRFCFHFSFRNITYENLKDLDYKVIIEVVLNNCKSFVKSYLS